MKVCSVNRIVKGGFFCLVVLLSPGIMALQTLKVKDGGTYQIKISKREMTRVAMQGDGRIDEYRGVEGMLDIKPDRNAGELYIMPTLRTPAKTSFFVSDDMGNVYTLIASITDVPSETILLKPRTRKRVESVEGDSRNNDYVNEVKLLIKNMAMEAQIPGYSLEDMGRKVPLWQEAEIYLRAEYVGHRFVGDIYTLKNISASPMRLDEGEFSAFGSDVRATAIEKHELQAGESTRIFVVRGSH